MIIKTISLIMLTKNSILAIPFVRVLHQSNIHADLQNGLAFFFRSFSNQMKISPSFIY